MTLLAPLKNLLFLLIPLLALPGLAKAEILRVGILNSPMTGFKDASGKLTGFEAELAEHVCERINQKCEFILQPFAHNLLGIQNGSLDLAFSSILITNARKELIIFSERYMRSVSSFIGNPSTQPKYRPVKVAVVKGSVQETFLRQKYSGTMQPLVFADVESAYLALTEKRVDRVLLPAIMQLGFLYNDDSGLFDLVGEPIDDPKISGDVAIAISQNQKLLKPEIDKALQSLLTDGSFNRLNNKYFPFNIY